MKIEIRKFLNKARIENQQILISERLPAQVMAPVHLDYSFSLEARDDYYILHLNEAALIQLNCQRCGENWEYSYQQSHEIAICRSDEDAEKYQSSYDLMVLPDLNIDILTVITDNLHLFLPIYHEKVENGDSLRRDCLKIHAFTNEMSRKVFPTP